MKYCRSAVANIHETTVSVEKQFFMSYQKGG